LYILFIDRLNILVCFDLDLLKVLSDYISKSAVKLQNVGYKKLFIFCLILK